MTGAAPLAGRRILVTRAPHQAGGLVQSLEELGAEVVRLATIEIAPPESYAPLDTALRNISSYQWLVLTSANAAEAMGQRMTGLNISPAAIAHMKVAAVGPATAEAIRKLGLSIDVLPESYVAESVVQAMREQVKGLRILLARAAVARDVIPDELLACGAQVDVVDAYRTVIPPTSVERARELFADSSSAVPDAVTFTSSSTVTNFFALLAAAEVGPPAALKAVSIGPITSLTLRRHGWEPSIEAAQSDMPGIVAACCKLLGS